MTIPHLSLSHIQRHATNPSFERGERLYQADAVISLSQRGTSLQALVEGSNVQPYQINAIVDTGGITQIHCNCPYNFEGWCKHIVAVLLTCHHDPDQIEQRPSLHQMLTELNLTEIIQLLQALVQQHPYLINDIDLALHTLKTPLVPTKMGKTMRHSPPDPAPFRWKVQQLLRHAVDAWESGYDDDPISSELQDLIRQAQAFSQQGDGASAIVILEAITQGCVEDWHFVEDYGVESYETVAFLDRAWAEAILTAELPPAQQQRLQSSLEAWQDQLDGEFVMSLTALQQGWDTPLLVQVLQGTITEQGIWPGEVPKFADELAQIRLQILWQQERYEEYLYLAEAEGQTEQYLTMLVRAGRIEEAVAIAKTEMTTMVEANALAQTLREQGAIALALEIAQLGLALPNPTAAPPNYQHLNLNYDLAVWTSDLAEGLANPQAALDTRILAFQAKPTLNDYLKAAELAGTEWPPLRKKLLQTLRDRTAWGLETAKVDIFLHEGLIDNAITTVTDLSYYAAPLIHRVMDAAMATHPDWVISNARKRAEEIIDRGLAKAYHHAANWLRKVHDAYYQAGRQTEWQTYRQQIMTIHSRKRNLMAILEHPDLR